MPIVLNVRGIDEARAYAAREACGGCGKAGTLSAYETRKEGPNRGRLFVKCRHCGRFDWLSAPALRDEEREAVAATAGPCPKCGKGRRAERVGKEGPNRGRLFLCCGDPDCDSFGWASPATRPHPARAPRPAPTADQCREERLLAEIREHPDDDTPRLIYADWLDDTSSAPAGRTSRRWWVAGNCSGCAAWPCDPAGRAGRGHASWRNRPTSPN